MTTIFGKNKSQIVEIDSGTIVFENNASNEEISISDSE